MVGQQRRQALAGAGRPRRHDDATRVALDAADVADDGVEHVDVALLALGREGTPAAPTPGAHVGAFAFLERRQAVGAAVGLRSGERIRIKEYAIRRHRLVRRTAELAFFQRLIARLIVLGDLLEAALGGFVAPVVEADGHAGQIVEERFEVIVEQRQPVLLPRIAVAGARPPRTVDHH